MNRNCSNYKIGDVDVI